MIIINVVYIIKSDDFNYYQNACTYTIIKHLIYLLDYNIYLGKTPSLK